MPCKAPPLRRAAMTLAPVADRQIKCMLHFMFRSPFVLAAGCLAALVAGRASAAEPPAEPRFELFSAGPAATAVVISKSDLEAIKLKEPIVISDAVTITHAGVGYFDKEGKSGATVFRPSAEVPFKTGQGFGWVMKVDAKESQIEVEEKFSLPQKNGTWTVDPDTTKVSDDGLTATTTETHTFWDFLWRVWTLEDGDPVGPHSFSLTVAGKPVAELKFTITQK
jgi:hypothetical protein